MAGRALLIDVVRSPFGRGREDGILHATHPVDLFAQTLQRLSKQVNRVNAVQNAVLAPAPEGRAHDIDQQRAFGH